MSACVEKGFWQVWVKTLMGDSPINQRGAQAGFQARALGQGEGSTGECGLASGLSKGHGGGPAPEVRRGVVEAQGGSTQGSTCTDFRGAEGASVAGIRDRNPPGERDRGVQES